MANIVNLTQEEPNFNTDEDRYPDFVPLMRRILQEAEIPEGPIERLEITCQANGEAAYRVWRARAEEPDMGHLPSPR